MSFLISVCEAKSGICNSYGASSNCGSASGTGCGKCREGYFGQRCEFCEDNPKFTIFEGVNGTVNSTSGKGIWCGTSQLLSIPI